MISITKRYTFEASHSLPYYEGACSKVHGHSYKVEVTISGEVETDVKNKKCGMIIDFKDLKKILEEEVGKYDHQHLNVFFENPTAENMVTTIFNDIDKHFKGEKKIKLKSVKLWETEDSYAECEREIK